MKLIDKIIKILINFKYNKEPFEAWSWGINDTHDINILSAEYYDDHYRYGTKEEYYKAENGAMRREEKICREVCEDGDGVDLVKVCREIGGKERLRKYYGNNIR